MSPEQVLGKAADVRVESYRLLNQGVAAYKRGDYQTALGILSGCTKQARNFKLCVKIIVNAPRPYIIGINRMGRKRRHAGRNTSSCCRN